MFSRHWFSTKLAKWLEPIAVKKSVLITGVAEGYYAAVMDRNPHLKKTAVSGAMPYGGEALDHAILPTLNLKPYLFEKIKKLQIVYAGAMLPKAYKPLQSIFSSIAAARPTFENIEFHFIGTGNKADDAGGYNIKPLAEQYGLWHSVVFEYPKRIPYLDVLVHLKFADGIFILGSTEPHYTPSKTYQGVLSAKPLLAILHKDSSAVAVIQQSKAGLVLEFNGEEGLKHLEQNFASFFLQYKELLKTFDPAEVDGNIFEQYSAKNVTSQLAVLLDKAVELNCINKQ